MGPIDRSLKLLAQHFPRELVALACPGRNFHQLEPLDKELPAASLVADKVYRVRSGKQEWLVHLEFAIHAGRAEQRLLTAAAFRLHLAYELGVQSVMIALSKPDALTPLPTHYAFTAAGRTRLRYGIDTVCLWDYDAEEALMGDSPVGWVLATHMHGGEQISVVARAAGRVRALSGIQERVRADLLAILRILGERSLQQDVKHLITREMLMGSTLYDEILEEGIEKGIEKGQKGLLMRLLRARFGGIPSEVERKLEALHESSTLEQLAERVLTARSLKELGLV